MRADHLFWVGDLNYRLNYTDDDLVHEYPRIATHPEDNIKLGARFE